MDQAARTYLSGILKTVTERQTKTARNIKIIMASLSILAITGVVGGSILATKQSPPPPQTSIVYVEPTSVMKVQLAEPKPAPASSYNEQPQPSLKISMFSTLPYLLHLEPFPEESPYEYRVPSLFSGFSEPSDQRTQITGIGRGSDKRKWEIILDGLALVPAYDAFLILDGYAYIATYKASDRQYMSHLYKIDASNGSIKWQRSYDDFLILASPTLQSEGKLIVPAKSHPPIYYISLGVSRFSDCDFYVIKTNNGDLIKDNKIRESILPVF